MSLRILNRVWFALLLAVSPLPVCGQEPSPQKLIGTDFVTVEGGSLGGFMVRVPARCDARGNLYFRYYSDKDPNAMPVVKISEKGKTEARFAIRSAPGFQQGVAYDFAVGIRGDLYLLAARRVGEREVVRFEPDGKFASAFKLDPSIDPHHLAVFPSGELLISGDELSTKNHRPTGRSLLSIYDPGGRFVREISLPRDETRSVQEDESSEVASFGTQAEPAEDGNLYLMRSLETPSIYVISPSGAVLRRIEIPSPGKDFRPGDFRIAGGNIVVEFYRDNPSGLGSMYVYSMIDSYSGEKTADYTPATDAMGIWACYAPGGWTFLSSRGNPPKMTIVKAKP